MLRPLLLLVALLLLAAGAIIVGWTTAPDTNTVFCLGLSGLAAWAAADLFGDRFP